MSTTTAPTASTDSLRGALATQAQQVAEVERTPDGQMTIAGLINAQRNEIARALPRHMDADRLARIATTVIKTNPKLMECSAASLLGSLMLSAQTGMEPGPLGHAYFVPRWNGKTNQLECQWQLGYKGIVELFRRSGHMLSIEAREVCEADEFDYQYGLDEKLVHKPFMGGERGDVVAVWGMAKFKDGGHYFVVLSRADIDKAMMRSETGKKGFGPWVDDYAAMARKTAVHRMSPYLPLSPEQAAILAHDESVHTVIKPDMAAEVPEAAWVEAKAELTPPPADANGEPLATAGEPDLSDGAAPEEVEDPDGAR